MTETNTLSASCTATGGVELDDIRLVRRAEVVKGQLVYLDQTGGFIDFGPAISKSEGWVSAAELERYSLTGTPTVGDDITVMVSETEDDEGRTVVSLSGVAAALAWEQAQAAYSDRSEVAGTVTKATPAGLVVSLFGGVRGFAPRSHLPKEALNDLASLVGSDISGVLIELDARRKSGVLSPRQMRRRQERREQRQNQRQALSSVSVGDKVVATVERVERYGALAKLPGGLRGLIHRSDLDYRRLEPAEAVSVGDELEVVVTKVERQGRQSRISLSRLPLLEDPFATFSEQTKPGAILAVRVVKLLGSGGAVVAVGDDETVTGMVPEREMVAGLAAGAPAFARVLRLDAKRRSCILSLRRVPVKMRAGEKGGEPVAA